MLDAKLILSADSSLVSLAASSLSASKRFTAYIELFEGTTNASAATSICDSLFPLAPGDAFEITTTSVSRFWIMPDCLYNSSVTSMVVKNMIFLGNVTYTDPLERLVKSLSASTSIIISNSWFNQIGASYPINWVTIFASLPAIQTLDLSSTKLTGSLPSAWPSTLNSLSVNYNSLSGSLPAALFNTLPSSVAAFSLQGIFNGFTGTIPNNLFGTTTFNALSSIYIDLRFNQLSGNLPAALFPQSSSYLTDFKAYLSSNPMTGTIPSALFSNIMNKGFLAAHPSVLIECISCQLTGALTLPTSNAAFANAPSFKLGFDSNNFTSIGFGSNVGYYLYSLTASNNPNMTGALTTFFSSLNSAVTILDFSGTAISGTMPDMTSSSLASTLETLIMINSGVQFCSPSNRPPWVSNTLTNCQIYGTEAATCPLLYPNCTTVTPPIASPPPQEIEIPFSVPVTAPVTAPVPVSECQQATKPSVGSFDCVNGAWTSNVSISAPIFVIPPGAVNTVTVIAGNVSSNEIVFQGLRNTLEIQGCATNLNSVTVNLKSEDLDQIGNSKLRQVLVSLTGSGTGCSDLSAVTVKSDVTGSTCKKVTTEKEPQSTQLVALFSVSDAGCKGKSNTWWIIVVSVVCGVVVIGVVVLILVFTFNKKARNCCRPYEDSDGRIRGTRVTSL